MLNLFCAKFASVNVAMVVFILTESSPQVYTGLSPGEHRLKCVPHISECGRRRRAIVIRFTVC